jgi:hypothetical protein
MISTSQLIKLKTFLLRIPVNLHSRLQASAREQGISLNQYCIRVLGGEILVGGQNLSDARGRQQSHNGSLAADHMARAEARMLAIDTLFEAESWADVVRESQEVVELALKGLMRWAGMDPLPDRETGETLLAGRKQLPAALGAELPGLAEVARRLRRDRDLAFYGSHDVTPWEFYRRQDAETARKAARRTLRIVRTHVLG